MKLKSLAPFLILALLATGCGMCSSGNSGKPAEEFIPADASFVLSAPSLGAIAKQVTALSDNLRAGPAGQKLVQGMAMVSRQVGFDPFTEEGLKSAGSTLRARLRWAAATTRKACSSPFPTPTRRSSLKPSPGS